MNLLKKLSFLTLATLFLLGYGCNSSKVSSLSPELQRTIMPTTSTLLTQVAIPTVTTWLTSTVASQIAKVEFRVIPVDLNDIFSDRGYELPTFEQYKSDGQAEFRAYAIYALDNDVVFVGGSLSFPMGNYERSLLLRSTDGGVHWAEVMPTTIVSYVQHIVFLGEGKGWALVTGVGELGTRVPTMLWYTTDYGTLWDIAGTVAPGSSIACWNRMLRFYDLKHGEISLTCRDIPGNSLEDYFAIIATGDGGQTWEINYHIPLQPRIKGDYQDERLLAAFEAPKGGRYGSHAGSCYPVGNDDACKAYGQDGSEWRMNYQEDDRTRLIVYHRLPTESNWKVYELPACFEYQQGQLIGPCEP